MKSFFFLFLTEGSIKQINKSIDRDLILNLKIEFGLRIKEDQNIKRIDRCGRCESVAVQCQNEHKFIEVT